MSTGDDEEQVPGQLDLLEEGRRLASQREDLIAQGVDPALLKVPLAPPDGHRDGATYDASLDHDRLNNQARRVHHVMRDGTWRGLAEIARLTGDPEASVSARLRDFRKKRFGGLTVERRRSAGTWQYRLQPKED